MYSSDPPTILVIDDTRVHYNTSRNAAQAIAPSKAVIDSVNGAKVAPWNFTLTAITSPVSIWYTVTKFSRIAVYGPIIPPSGLGVTAWANYTINGNYTAANITTTDLTVTAPLFTSVELDPNRQYNLTVDIWASPDAPYLLDYFLAFSPPSDPTPISTSTRSTASSIAASSTVTGTPAAIPSSSGDSVDIPHPIIIIGALAGTYALLLVMWLVTLCCWCRSRGSKHKAMEGESVGIEPLFAPRPTVNTESATLVSTNASRHAGSFLEPSALPVSASTLAATTTAPASAPAAISAAAAAASAPAKLGPNEYSPEEEVRLEPAAAQMHASASSPERKDFADSPPAYSS